MAKRNEQENENEVLTVKIRTEDEGFKEVPADSQEALDANGKVWIEPKEVTEKRNALRSSADRTDSEKVDGEKDRLIRALAEKEEQRKIELGDRYVPPTTEYAALLDQGMADLSMRINELERDRAPKS